MKTLHTIYNNFAKRNLASLRLLIVVFLILTITTNAWGAEDDTYDFPQNISVSLNNCATFDDIELPEQDYPIKEVIITYAYNKSASPKAIVTIDNEGIGTKSFTGTGNLTTYKTLIFSLDSPLKGSVIISNISASNCSGTGKGTLKITNVTLVEGAPAAPCTVTLKDDNSTLTQSSAGESVTLPPRNGCDGYTFVGWTKSWSVAQTTWTTTAPTIIPAGSYTPTADESLYPVYTKTEGGGTAYEKVTTLTEGVYVMVSEKTSGIYKYMPNTTSSGSNPTLGSGITMNSGKTILTNEITEAMLWDLTATGTSNQYYLRPHGSTTIGLGCTSSTGANIRISTSYKDVKWTITTSSNYGWQFKSDATTAMYLAVYDDDNWRNYKDATTNQKGKFYLFKQTSSSTTSYISVPDCDPCNALQAPNVTAKNITTNSFTLSWAAVPGATSYNVYNYTTDEGYETTDLTYTFNGLDPNTEYDWEVEAVSATCNGKGTTGTTTTLKTYTITWKNADGTVLETDENVPHGTTPTYNGATPTKTATAQYTYTFSDWSPTIYAADKDQIYTAQFSETLRQYTVTFNANGHGTAPDAQKVDYNKKATEPTEPTAFGYTFGGWYKEAECTNVWDFATDVVTGNITLYAKWTEKELTNYRTACDVLCYGAYSFHTGDDDVKTNNTGTCFEQLDNTTEWQITNYTIPADKKYFVGYLGYYYDDNLGTNNARSAVKTWAEEMYIAPAMDSDDATNSPKLGQATGAVGTLRIFDDSEWNNLYVGFIPDGYKLKFGNEEYTFAMHNEGDREYRSEAVVEYNSTTADKNVSVGIVDADGNYVATNHSQEMRHIFVKDTCGWRNDDAKLAIYYWGGSEGWCGFLKTVPGDETLFEGWIPSNATDLKFVRYNSNQSNPGSWDYENAIWNSTGNLTIDGNLFTITDWGTGTWSTYEKYGQFAMHDNSKSKNWYVHFIPHNALKYDKNADEATGTMNVQTVVYDAEDKNVTVAECGFTRNGYRFIKWRKDNTNTYYNSGVTIDLDKDITLYAQWEKEYTVTYNANGGVTTCVDNNIYIKGDEVTVCTENPSKEGHTFLGWSDGINTYSAGATFTMPANDVTLTAQWQINQYTVTLNPNYPAGKTGTFTDKEGNTVNGNLELIYDYNTASKTITDLYTSLTLDGYEFGGWYNANGSNPGEVSGSKCTVTDNITGNKTYYAKWTKLYSITLSENGTTKELDPQTSTSYTLPTELSVGTCDNDENELVGWSTVTIPTPGDKPTTNFYDLGETVTLTADQTTFYAVFAKPGGASVWAKTDIANIGELDEVVICMEKSGYLYAATNDNGTKDAPDAISLRDKDGIINPDDTPIPNELKWNISNNNGNLTIYPNGTTDTWLYNTNTNDGVLVGNNDNKVYVIKEGTGDDEGNYFLYHTYTSRYLGVYILNEDWRCYTSVNSNITGQTVAFYKKKSSLTNYTTTCLSKHSIIYDFNGGAGNCEEEKVTHGENYTICSDIPTKLGYTFLHWANGEDTYAPGTTIENVQADITLTATWKEREKYTLTFDDQGDTKVFQYIESLPVEMQEPWADICSGPIQYVFDGWAKAPVNNGTTEYEKVDFSTFTMPAENRTLYAVYRYAEDGGEPVNGFVKVTETLTDWSGDYVIVDDENLFAIKNAYRENTSSNKTLAGETVTIENDKVVSPSANIVWSFSKNGNGYTMYNVAADIYVGIGTHTRAAVLSEIIADENNIKIIFDDATDIAKVSGIKNNRCFQYYVTNDEIKEWRTYDSDDSRYNTGFLYRLSEKTILYTSSLICGSITAEDALVTSTKDQKVKVKVPITLESSTGATTINATSDNAAFDVTGLTDVEAGDHTIVIEYTPAEYNITETANITLSATNGATTTFTVTGRSLPEKFVIATKVGATWYALPANMNGATNPEGVVIDVDETTMTATAPNTTVYTLFPVATVDGNSDRYKEYGERLRFAAVNNDNRGLWANDAKSGTTINNDAKITAANSTAGAAYEWKITTTIVDGNWQYTLQTDQPNNQKYLRYWTAASGGAKWGTYASGNEQLYFLPVTTYTDLDLEIMEWGTNSMVIRAGEDLPQNVNITINGTTTQKTLQNINGSDLYKIDDVTLTSDDCGTIIIDNGSNARKIIRKPLLVSGNKSGPEYTTSPGRDICAECDIVILNGGKLIADEAKTTGSHVDFANIYVYPGGKLVLDGKSLGVKRQVYLRGGYSWINQTTYALPEVYVNGDINFNGSGNIIYDYYIQNYKYYQFSLPYQVPLANVTDEAGVDDFPVWVKHYNGALRAANANATSWEWYYGDNFEAGIGYIIAAQPRQVGKVANRPLSIIRFPLGNSDISSAEADKSIATTAHGIDAYNAGTITANNVGWNFIGNPFMATWKGDIGHQQLMKSPDAEHWNGSYHWEDNGVKYITVMSPEDGTDYDQYIAANTELKPFFPFYLQETADGGTGTINFATANRIQKAPAMLSVESPREAFVQIEIEAEGIVDQTGMFVGDDYSDDIDFDDLEKMFGSATDKPKVWIMHENKRMAFEAMTESTAAIATPLGYRAPNTGEYILVLNEMASSLDEVEAVYLTDNETGVTDFDLMLSAYEFETTNALYNDTRFSIRIVLKDDSPGLATDLDYISADSEQPFKFFYQDKLYIMRNGVIYDATGKQVHVINE